MPTCLVIALAELICHQSCPQELQSVAASLANWQPSLATKKRFSDISTTGSSLDKLRMAIDEYAVARDALVSHNLRLVYSIAGKYCGKGVSFIDHAQEGVIGLIRAAEKFDYLKGYRFSTYTYNWITQAVRRCTKNTGALIRYPTHVHDKIGQLYGERAKAIAETNRQPGDSELGRRIGATPEKTRALLHSPARAFFPENQ